MTNNKEIDITHKSFDPTSFTQLFEAEDLHFWFRARNWIITALSKQITADMTPGFRVLEVGCGTGNVLRFLERACKGGEIIGMDLFSEGLHYAQLRTSCNLVQGDIHASPFAAQFDLICLFDVLEHLPDDIDVLRKLHNMLTDNGVLFLTLPANPSLWSYFDEASHHCRRYELDELNNKLIRTGYQVEYLTYYMASIFPIVWLGRRLNTWIDSRLTNDLALKELHIIPVVNEILNLLLYLEAHLITHRKKIPFGTSLIAVAHKTRL